MRQGVALSLAQAYARGRVSDLVLMGLGVALAAFVSGSAAWSGALFAAELRAQRADPSYREINVSPSAFSRNRSAAVEALNLSAMRGFALPDDLAAAALAQSPSLAYAYSYDRSIFSVGEGARAAFGGESPAVVARVEAAQFGQGGRAAGAGATFMMQAPPEGAGGPPPEFGAAPGMGPAPASANAEELAAAAALEKPLVDTVAGVRADPAFFEAYGLRPAKGSLFTEGDAAAGRATLVVGSSLASRLYADGEALGKFIRLDGVTYEIVGVLAPTAAAGGVDWNDLAYAPYRDIRINAGGQALRFRSVNLRFAARSPELVGRAVEELKAYAEAELGAGIVTVNSRKAELDERARSQATLLAVAYSLAGLCVLVAVLNLMNSAAARAMRRRRSMGVLRAIGATGADVAAAAFWESAFPAAGGLALGLTLAVAMRETTGALLMPLALPGSGDITAGLALVAGALLAAALPLALGVVPARAAARVAPAELVRPE
jgi:hypothetical protein